MSGCTQDKMTNTHNTRDEPVESRTFPCNCTQIRRRNVVRRSYAPPPAREEIDQRTRFEQRAHLRYGLEHVDHAHGLVQYGARDVTEGREVEASERSVGVGW